jgi:hypothetical protein
LFPSAGRPLAATLAALMPVALCAADSMVIEHTPVHCIVAKGYPRLEACFEPAVEVGSARVYFRGRGEDWYYVEMAPASECYSAILPKPTSQLQKFDYYIEVVDKSFKAVQSPVYDPAVVPTDDGCAPFLKKAAVTVGGAAVVPSGFAAAGILGVGTSAAVTTAAVVGGAVAAVGGAVAVGGGGGSATTRPPATDPPQTTVPGPPPTTRPGATTTTTLLPPPTSITLPPTSITLPITLPPTTVTIPTTITLPITLPPTTVTIPTTITLPITLPPTTVTIPTTITLPITLPPTTVTIPTTITLPITLPPTTVTIPTTITLPSTSITLPPTTLLRVRRASEPRSLPWQSDLLLRGGHAQLIANGTALVYLEAGRTEGTLAGVAGENRIEMQIVDGAGVPGLWRVTIGPGSSLVRIIAGEGQVQGSSVIFRLKGVAGERVVLGVRVAP